MHGHGTEFTALCIVVEDLPDTMTPVEPFPAASVDYGYFDQVLFLASVLMRTECKQYAVKTIIRKWQCFSMTIIVLSNKRLTMKQKWVPVLG